MSPGADAKEGVRYRYYEFDVIPETPEAVREMKPVKEGTVKGFDLSPKKRESDFAFVFDTFFEVAQDDDYTFTIASDDGSFPYVDGALLIDNGGLHGHSGSALD